CLNVIGCQVFRKDRFGDQQTVSFVPITIQQVLVRMRPYVVSIFNHSANDTFIVCVTQVISRQKKRTFNGVPPQHIQYIIPSIPKFVGRKHKRDFTYGCVALSYTSVLIFYYFFVGAASPDSCSFAASK